MTSCGQSFVYRPSVPNCKVDSVKVYSKKWRTCLTNHKVNHFFLNKQIFLSFLQTIPTTYYRMARLLFLHFVFDTSKYWLQRYNFFLIYANILTIFFSRGSVEGHSTLTRQSRFPSFSIFSTIQRPAADRLRRSRNKNSTL